MLTTWKKLVALTNALVCIIFCLAVLLGGFDILFRHKEQIQQVDVENQLIYREQFVYPIDGHWFLFMMLVMAIGLVIIMYDDLVEKEESRRADQGIAHYADNLP